MQDGPGPWARFDDLVAQTAQVFEAVQQVLVAQRPEEVVEVLDAVERLASQGKWAFGYVAYEAAPGLDPGFTVRPPIDGLPLAWFAITDAPRQVPVVRHETDRSHLARAAGPWQREWEWDEPTHARAVATVRSHIAATSRRRPFTTRLARHPEADDVLLVNEYGELTGACTANLAVRLDGVWWTPPLGSGCFPGVERARLVDTHQLGERPLRRQDLARAEAVALVSSLRGWRSATVLTRTAGISSPDTTWHRTSA